MRYVVFPGFLAALFLLGCHRPSPGGTIIARVGDEVLTLEQAKASVDTTSGVFERRLSNYVSTWVTNEILFQEARRTGTEHAESFQRELAEAERQLVIQHFLRQRLFADTTAITEDSMQTYFQQHAPEFFVREDMMKLNLIAFSTRERASSFAASVSRGAAWEEALSKVRADTASSAAIVSMVSNKYYSLRTLYPPELWKVASTLGSNEVSFPVKTSMGYFVLQSLAMVQQGKEARLELVRDEVRDRILIERRRQQYENLLGTLRKQYNVEIIPPSTVSSDSTDIQSHE